MSGRAEKGFALITVIAVVLLVSAVALTLASTLRVEARQVSSERAALELDELAAAGQEMAVYLASRALGSTVENFEGLPVAVVQPGFQYRLQLPGGAVDLYLEAEDGKINLSSAPDIILERFFTLWAGNAARGQELAVAVQDWRDADDEGPAEVALYVSSGYAPRNRALGIADLALLPGILPEHFRDRLELVGIEPVRQPGLSGLLTHSPVGGTINPNFAPELVLNSIPGLSGLVSRVVAERHQRLFRDQTDFSDRVGISIESPAWTYLHFQKRAPAILTVARSEDGHVVRAQRRVSQPLSITSPLTGLPETVTVVGLVEHNTLPFWLASAESLPGVPR